MIGVRMVRDLNSTPSQPRSFDKNLSGIFLDLKRIKLFSKNKERKAEYKGLAVKGAG